MKGQIVTATDQSPAAGVTAIRQRYLRHETLRSGRMVGLRLMDSGDRDAVLAFARELPPDDLLYLRWDITDARVMDEWLENIHRNRTVSVLAYDGDRIVGEGSLSHHETDWTRHIGDIRLVTSPEVRGEGLGRLLTDELVANAALLGLERLSAQMSNDEVGPRVVFSRLGFEPVGLLQNYVIDRAGKKHDLLVMTANVAELHTIATQRAPD